MVHIANSQGCEKKKRMRERAYSSKDRFRHVFDGLFLFALSLPVGKNGEPLPNPYADPELNYKLPNDLQHWLYERSRLGS